MGTIWVEAHPSLEDGRVAFWEPDDQHPENPANSGDEKQEAGEIYIVAGAPNAPFEVEQTPGVMQAIAEQRLIQTDAKRSRATHESAPQQSGSQRTAASDSDKPSDSDKK